MKATDKPQINVRLEPKLWEKLHQQAFSKRTSKTEIVEKALEKFLYDHKN